MSDQHHLASQLEGYRPLLLAVALDRTGDPELARDIAQEAMELALRHLDRLREPAALPAWLRTIAINCCRQHVRRGRERPAGLAILPEQESEAVHRIAVRREMMRQVRRALRRLPENNRLALMLHVLHGLPYQQIAAALGVPVTTIEGRIHRARRELRREHEKWLVEATGEWEEESR
jgi:RNA polymerase sigma-70 factor (ECF subfamily)